MARGALPAGLRAVLLDGLGTLLSLAPPAPALVRSLNERHGVVLRLGDAERAFAAEIAYYRAHHLEGRDTAGLADLRRRCADALRAALPDAVGARLDDAQLTEAMLDSLRFVPYPDVVATLGALRGRGLSLVVVSNWDVSLSAVLAELGLLGLLDGVVTSADVGKPKPDAAIFRAALELAGTPPGCAVHVGDSPELDLVGALAAGVAAVLLRRPGEAQAAKAPVLDAPSLDPLALTRPSLDSPVLVPPFLDPLALAPRSLDPKAGGVPVIASLADLLA